MGQGIKISKYARWLTVHARGKSNRKEIPRTADEGLPAPRAGEPNALVPKSLLIGEGDPSGHVFLGQVERDFRWVRG